MSDSRLDPRNDIVFRILFSDEKLVVPLLEAVLRPPRPIVRAVVKNPELPKTSLDDKGGYLDLLLTLDDGSLVDVEMQCARRGAFAERVLYYWASVYADQLASGDDYRRLVPVISVLFLDYTLLSTESFHEVFRLVGAASGVVFSQHCVVHTLELPKVRPDGGLLDAAARWCRFFTTEDRLEVAALAEQDAGIAMAEKRLTELSADPRVRELARWRHRIEMGQLIERDGDRREAQLQGREEGREQGLAEARRMVCHLLETQLEQRFGPLGARERELLEQADLATLSAWGVRLASVTSLAELLG